jgi:hypothetical protein
VRDAARLVATFPPEHVPRQVVRLTDRLDLDHATVTGAVVDALTQDADARGDLALRDRRRDLDRGKTVTARPAPVQLARAGFPAALPAGLPRPGAAPTRTDALVPPSQQHGYRRAR